MDYEIPTVSIGLLVALDDGNPRVSRDFSQIPNINEEGNLLIGVLTQIATDEENDRVDMFESILESGLSSIRYLFIFLHY
jgi:hypothetical protein